MESWGGTLEDGGGTDGRRMRAELASRSAGSRGGGLWRGPGCECGWRAVPGAAGERPLDSLAQSVQGVGRLGSLRVVLRSLQFYPCGETATSPLLPPA